MRKKKKKKKFHSDSCRFITVTLYESQTEVKNFLKKSSRNINFVQSTTYLPTYLPNFMEQSRP
jgi:hypothetical protein